MQTSGNMAEMDTKTQKKSHRKGRFILLVDDDSRTLLYLSTLLKRFDYQTYTAGAAREVFELVTSSVPALMIVSLDHKNLDGLQLMQVLKKNPMTAAMPVITVTRNEDVSRQKLSFLHGAADCLSFPVTPERLFRAVQKEVENTPRTCIRIPMLLPVKITSMPGEGYRTCTLDLSERGMFLAWDEPAAVNTRISLLINLNGRLIPVEAKVLQSIPGNEGPYLQAGMALEFLQIDPSDREAIRQFIRDDVMRGIER
jgi:CheY-like chemotaxis protein